MSLEEDLAALSIEQAYTIRVFNRDQGINGLRRFNTGLDFADDEKSDNQTDNQGPAKEVRIHEDIHVQHRRTTALYKARDKTQKKRFDPGPVEVYDSDSDGEEMEELSDTERARQADPEWWERVKKNTEAYIAKQAAIMHQCTLAN